MTRGDVRRQSSLAGQVGGESNKPAVWRCVDDAGGPVMPSSIIDGFRDTLTAVRYHCQTSL